MVNNRLNRALKDAGDNWLHINGEPYNKVKQREFMQNKSMQGVIDSFDITASIAPETKDKGINPCPEPYKGVMAETVANVLASAHKPQPNLTTLSVVIGMASAISGNYHLSDGTRLNLYGLGVAETGEGKDIVGRTAENVALDSGALLIGKPASGQGLEDALVDNKGMLIRVDEVGHMLQSMNHTKAPSYQIELNENLLKLYSSSSGRYATRVKAAAKNALPPRILQNPCLSFIGFTTPAALAKGLSLSNIEQGLLGRFLFVEGESGVKQKRSTAPLLLNKEPFENFKVEQMFDEGGTLNYLMSKQISESNDADIRLTELMDTFCAESTKAGTPEARALLKRSYEKVARISAVLAVWDNSHRPVIELDHVNWAEKLVRYSDGALLTFAQNKIHENEQLADAAKVFEVIEKIINKEIRVNASAQQNIKNVNINWVARSAALNSSKLGKEQFDKAVTHLIALGKLGNGSYNNPVTNKGINYLYIDDV
jgi:hypothetical protein